MDQSLYVFAVGVVFGIMAIRATQSGEKWDYLLAASQFLGIMALISPFQQWALTWLLATAAAYLISQIVTGARPLSRILPVTGAALVIVALL